MPRSSKPRTPRGRQALAALGLCAALAGPAAAQPLGTAERGGALAERWCTECHATGTSPRASDAGPAFPTIARTRSDDYVRGFLANPHVRGQMPPFDLSTAQIEDLVAYLQSLR
ncbi:MAG: cytochrome c [Thalassobaculum sp.]|uniref:c-type cytochrome n=1 Tax=Thalassobaculum sp. TaxID=2022740 RepID=UPI0032EE50AC